MPNSHGNGEPHHQTILECSKEFSKKHKCNAPCMAMASSNQDLKSIRVAFPANISAASTSRSPSKDGLSTDVAIKNKNGNEKPHHRNTSRVEKGKQPIIYDPDASRSSSNRRKENQEYFDSFNSRDNVSKVKRARIYELESEKFIGSKRLRRLSNENCSFINWMTALTSGLNMSFKAPMEVFQNPSQHKTSLASLPLISDDSREYISVSHGIKGFRSIFQAMCFPGFNASSNKVIYSSLKGTEEDKANRFAFCERLNGQQSCFPASNFSSGENDSTDPDSYGITPKMNGIECKDKIQDSCVELMTQSRHVSLNSSWIKRFSHGVSSPQQKIMEYSNFLDLSAQKLHSGLRHKVPNLEDHKIRLNYSHGSNYFKRSKPKASFARRLDALKLSMFLKIKDDDDTRDKKICLFCGMSDHTIRECSVVIDTGKEKYLKSNALCDNIKTTSCFCILCYQIDHWAVACSNACYEGNHISFKANCLVDANFRIKTEKKHGNHPFFKKDHHQVQHGSSFQREKKALETSIVDCSKVRSCKNKSAVYGAVNFCMDRLNDTVNTDKMKLVTFCSSGGKLKKSEFMPFCSHSFAATDPKIIFAAVQKLRLSRKDVLRWIKSRAPHNLGGFFLRLRIGQDKSTRGTSYHVACINGAIYQNSISVCVGSSSYSVTSRFISNHDFEEDELKAWWFQSLKDGSKMPSSEELSDKLLLKLKFGF